MVFENEIELDRAPELISIQLVAVYYLDCSMLFSSSLKLHSGPALMTPPSILALTPISNPPVLPLPTPCYGTVPQHLSGPSSTGFFSWDPGTFPSGG